LDESTDFTNVTSLLVFVKNCADVKYECTFLTILLQQKLYLVMRF